MVNLFLNGEAMRGGRLHHTVAGHPFLGEVRTAPRYRFYSVRDEFPGLAPAADGADGAGIAGELYDVPLAVIAERFLPDEPPELELGVVQLEDGSYALAVQLRPGETGPGRHQEITSYGGWRAYRAAAAG
ncbi:MAG TPA: gamma-glutamylcyclotransferase [Kribbellaceae bacterium]|nr:gamma-glutamylcyclotransferase [Kribbellaceae bacterium]